MSGVFFELTIIICLVAILTVIFRLLRQPPILAYILTGIIIGPFGQLQLHNQEILKTMGEFGITFLLFMMGLELKFKDLHSLGKSVLIIGISQIVFTSIAGYLLALLFGFSLTSSFYISIALTFSSTIIIVKLLSDKKELTTLFGKILIGLLLIQDFFAILILILLSSFNSSSGILNLSFLPILLVLTKGLILFIFVGFLSKSIFPKLIHLLARSSEILFLVSIAWVFILAWLVSSPLIGFSIEIGGFLAGLALANAIENFQIAARIRALRDFFITIFFVMLGMEMATGNLGHIWLPVFIFSIFVLTIKPLIISLIMGLIGYRKRTSFLTGVHSSQISEFSLVIVFLGNRLGHMPSDVVSLITGIGILTFLCSNYAIINVNKLYKIFGPYFVFFEKKQIKKEELGFNSEELGQLKNHVILVGAGRMGQSILDALEDLKEKVAVVDFDPDIVRDIKHKNIISVFGDISDSDIQQRLSLSKAKLVISTVPELEDNILLIKGVKNVNKDAKIIVEAYDMDEARSLYREGADYVVLPFLAGGRHVAKILKEKNLDEMTTYKSKDLIFVN